MKNIIFGICGICKNRYEKNSNIQKYCKDCKKSKKHLEQRYCKDCGKIISKNAIRCKKCVAKKRIIHDLNYCLDCGIQIHYTNKRCKKCNDKFITKEKNYCIDCGKEIYRSSIRCDICNRKFRSKKGKYHYIDLRWLTEQYIKCGYSFYKVGRVNSIPKASIMIIVRKLNFDWKRLKPKKAKNKCINCGIEIGSTVTRCQKCYFLYKKKKRKINQCIECNIEISKKAKRCRSCYNKKSFKINCVVCHKPIIKNSPNQKYCKKCKLLNKPKYKNKKIISVKKCLICKKDIFITTSCKNKKYCSLKCVWEGKKYIKKGRKQNFCVVCNQKISFYATRCITCFLKYRVNNIKSLSKLVMKIRNLEKYKSWRFKVLKIDSFKCQECGKKKNLIVHHIKELNKIVIEMINALNIIYPIDFYDNKEKIMNYEPLWDLSNGVTLCTSCHINKHFHLQCKEQV